MSLWQPKVVCPAKRWSSKAEQALAREVLKAGNCSSSIRHEYVVQTRLRASAVTHQQMQGLQVLGAENVGWIHRDYKACMYCK